MNHAMMMGGKAAELDQTLRRLFGEETILRRRYAERKTTEILDRLSAKRKEIADVIAPYYPSAAVPLQEMNAKAIAMALGDRRLEAMIDQLGTPTDVQTAFDKAFAVADEIANLLIAHK